MIRWHCFIWPMNITHLLSGISNCPLKSVFLDLSTNQMTPKFLSFLKDWKTASQLLVELSWPPNLNRPSIWLASVNLVGRSGDLRCGSRPHSLLSSSSTKYSRSWTALIDHPLVYTPKMNPMACPNQKSKNYWKECLRHFFYQNSKFGFIQEGRLTHKVNLLPPTTKQQLDLLRFNGLLA